MTYGESFPAPCREPISPDPRNYEKGVVFFGDTEKKMLKLFSKEGIG